MCFPNYFCHSYFVGRIGIGVNESNREAFDLLIIDPLRECANRGFIQRDQHFASPVESLADFPTKMTWHQRGGAIRRDVVLRKSVLLSHFDRVAQPFCNDECRSSATPLDQRVRRQRSAVHNGFYIVWRGIGCFEQSPNAFQHRFFRRIGCCEQFFCGNSAWQGQGQVGECAADIGGEANSWT